MKFLIKLTIAIFVLAILFCFDRFANLISQGQPARLEATINGRFGR